ncbi:MAG: PilZ domain-containing protein [Deltaproteobacteria bacterium]|nr:PilZ domain-containing protein [Deltaproteobacteria bacterium]
MESGAVALADLESPEPRSYRIRDLGSGGFYLEGQTGWAEGSAHRVRVSYQSVEVELSVVVARIDPQGSALCFADADPAAADKVRALCDHLLQDGATMDEKRRAPRLALTGVVAVWAHGDAPQTGVLTELSSTGATIRAETRPPTGDELELRFGADGADQLCCAGRVVRQLDDGFAVMFLRVDAAAKSAISEFRRLQAKRRLATRADGGR